MGRSGRTVVRGTASGSTEVPLERTLKISSCIIVPFLLAGGGGLAYLQVRYPDVGPAPSITVPRDPPVLDRGRYLARHVALCIDCHSKRDWTRYAGPVLPGTEGMGGQRFAEDIGLPGVFRSPNITPAAIGSWTDGELWRAVAEGVSRDGRSLFPFMPYLAYGRMAEEDLSAVLAYVRTLPSIPGAVPERQLDFPVNLLVRTFPKKASPAPRPPESDRKAYGAYLAAVASCADCHTPQEGGKPVAGMEYAGGYEFRLPFGIVRSANITPDRETGIGTLDRAAFVAKFKAFDPGRTKPIDVSPGTPNTIMPWTEYAGMNEDDLGAIHEYLGNLKPVRNPVERFTLKP
jgi:mono/diheme cytochrome c family protein